MNKYGIEHFHIEQLEETNNAEEREQYWIKKLNTYHNGYNATLGGDGKRLYNYDLIIETYKKLQNIQEVGKQLNIHPDTVSNILKSNHISIKSSQQIQKEKYGKITKMYSLTGELLNTFPSINAAANYMVNNQLTNCKQTTIKQHIHEVCEGKRKTAAKYKWSY